VFELVSVADFRGVLRSKDRTIESEPIGREPQQGRRIWTYSFNWFDRHFYFPELVESSVSVVAGNLCFKSVS
jgi:hypothetical protein